MTDKEVMQLALESIEWLCLHLKRDHQCLHMNLTGSGIPAWLGGTEEALRTALAQPEPEPVASVTVSHYKGLANRDMDYWGNLPDGTYRLYTAPLQREWAGLTAYEIQELHLANPHWGNFACAVQVKLKEKNA